MNYTDYYFDLLLEAKDRIEFAKEFLATSLSDENQVKYLKLFTDLDPTYNTSPKNPEYVIRFVKWFLEDPTEQQYRFIKNDFETYLELKQKHQWNPDDASKKDIRKFDKFSEFSGTVHALDAKYNPIKHEKDTGGVIDNGSTIKVLGKTLNKKDVTHVSDDLVVARADDMATSIKYGSDFSNWCTARTDTNFFYRYKFGSYGSVGASTMYYVYFPKRYAKDPNDLDAILHFGVNKEGQISFTNRSNSESVETLDWLQNQYEEFDGLNMKTLFPYHGPTNREKEIVTLNNEISDEQFLKLNEQEKILYIQSGENRIINLNKFNSLNEESKVNYIEQAIQNEIGINSDILINIKDTSFGRRYINKLTARQVYELLDKAIDLQSMANTLGQNNIDKLDGIQLSYLLLNATRNPQSLQSVVNMFSQHNKLNNLSSEAVSHLLANATDLQSMVNVLGQHNIDKLSSNSVIYLLNTAKDLQSMVNVLGQHNINKLSEGSIYNLLLNTQNFQLMANVLGRENINKLTGDQASTVLFFNAKTAEEIISILGKDNINKLNDRHLARLLNMSGFGPVFSKLLLPYIGRERLQRVIDTHKLDIKLPPISEPKFNYKQYFKHLF
jgi:hypothetical protein